MHVLDSSRQQALTLHDVLTTPENTKAVSQILKLWEAKQASTAQRAAKGAGLTLLAVSLAACGGSDNTSNTNTNSEEGEEGQVDTTPVTPPEDGTDGLPEGFVPFFRPPISGAEIELALGLFPGLVGLFPGFGGGKDDDEDVFFTITALDKNEFSVDEGVDEDDYTDNRGLPDFNGASGSSNGSSNGPVGLSTNGGGSSGPDGGNGLTALELAPGTEAIYDAIKIVSEGGGGGSENLILGGRGGDGADGVDGTFSGVRDGGDGGNGGNGGHAIDNGLISAIKIVGDFDLVILGGDGGSGGRGGDGFVLNIGNNNSIDRTGWDGGDGGDGGAGGTGLAIGGDGGDGSGWSVNLNNSGALTGGNGGNGGKGGGNGGDGGRASVNSNNSGTLTGGNGGDGGKGGGNGGEGGRVGVTSNNSGTLTGGNGGDGTGDGGDGGRAGVTSTNDGDLIGGNGGDGVNPGAGGTALVTSGNNGSSTSGAAGNNIPGSPIESDAIIAAFSARVDVDASEFTGHLTISGSDFDDTFIAGSGGSRFYATKGSDAYIFGTGEDILIITALDQSDGSPDATDKIFDFDFGVDAIDLSAFGDTNIDDLSNDGDVFQVDATGDNTPDIFIEIVGLGDWVTGGGDLGFIVAPT